MANNKEFIINIVGMIDEASLEVLPMLQDIAVESPTATVKVLICSSGGEEDVGYAIYDALKGMPNPVETYGYGSVHSIAALIFQAGDTRYMSPNTTLMIHNGSIVMTEAVTFDKLHELSGYYTNSNKRYYSAIAERSGMTASKVKDYCDKESWFNAGEAIAAGLCDKIDKDFLKCGHKSKK
jgi:ATP-dependent Clp protease protease subunit